ncbi:LysM peptidoglycan-binding domain-containing protein [Rhodoblastus sp.]|uniref:LysM peptidoglycan-binding domain-containing protein n=1 Tax=Rhodoblastus sp. TaxID=1962975 RepID=UPI0026288280|nr:LysM peptidoglycan-binding domain-containing protein [Rhodoblastus sp.]
MYSKAGQWRAAATSVALLLCVATLAIGWRLRLPARLAPDTASPAPAANLAAASPPASDGLAPRPSERPASATPEAPRADVVRVLPNGDVVVAGRAAPGVRVALLDNDRKLIETQGDPKTGEFVMLPPRLPAGAHRLALIAESPAGSGPTVRRDLTAFSIAPEAAPSPAAVSATPAAPVLESRRVVRGDTLWRISRETLGRGALYDSIFQSNSGKIRDPNLIYPGQSLTVPAATGAGSRR